MRLSSSSLPSRLCLPLRLRSSRIWDARGLPRCIKSIPKDPVFLQDSAAFAACCQSRCRVLLSSSGSHPDRAGPLIPRGSEESLSGCQPACEYLNNSPSLPPALTLKPPSAIPFCSFCRELRGLVNRFDLPMYTVARNHHARMKRARDRWDQSVAR